jgi:hypothetical protein
MAYLLREGTDEPRVVHDRHVLGLFPRDTWMSLLEGAGFAPQTRTSTWIDDGDDAGAEIFLASRPL